MKGETFRLDCDSAYSVGTDSSVFCAETTQPRILTVIFTLTTGRLGQRAEGLNWKICERFVRNATSVAGIDTTLEITPSSRIAAGDDG
jgi:hypothetical protein